MERPPKSPDENDDIPALQRLLGAVAHRLDYCADDPFSGLPDYSVSEDKQRRLLQSPWFATIRIALNHPIEDQNRSHIAQHLSAALAGRGPLVGIEPDSLVTMFAVANGSPRARQMAEEFADATHTALQDYDPGIVTADVLSYKASDTLKALQDGLAQGPGAHVLDVVDLYP